MARILSAETPRGAYPRHELIYPFIFVAIGTFVGSLMVGPFSSWLGRKYGLWGATILNFIATSVMLGSTSVGALYAARLLLGISVGWFLTFSQLYVHEVAPAHLRGITFAVYQAQLSIGSIVEASVDFGTAGFMNKNAYRTPLAVFFVAPTIQSICLFFFPETPRWLMVQGKEDQAEQSLRKLLNSNIDEHQFQAGLNEIRGSTREQVEQNKKALFLEMWRGTNLRRTGLSIAVICFHAANGTFATSTIRTALTRSRRFLLGKHLHNLLPRNGRRSQPLRLLPHGNLHGPPRRHLQHPLRAPHRPAHHDALGVLACGFSQLAQAIAWTVAPNTEQSGKVVVAFIALFTFFYVAYAPYAWLLGGEYPNSALRGYVFGLATALNFLGNWLGTFTAPYLINPAGLNWGPKYGYIWFGSNMLLAVFTWFYIPETRDRTLEEIHEMFEAGVPARKFKTYVCHGVEAYAAEGLGKEGVEREKGGIHVEAEDVGTKA